MAKKLKPPTYKKIGQRQGTCKITGIRWCVEHRQTRQWITPFDTSDSYWLYLNDSFKTSFKDHKSAMHYIQGYIQGYIAGKEVNNG